MRTLRKRTDQVIVNNRRGRGCGLDIGALRETMESAVDTRVAKMVTDRSWSVTTQLVVDQVGQDILVGDGHYGFRTETRVRCVAFKRRRGVAIPRTGFTEAELDAFFDITLTTTGCGD